MIPEEHIISLQGELLDLQRGAVRLLLTVAHAVSISSEDRQDLALFIAAAGSGSDPATARLARVAAEAIHRGELRERMSGDPDVRACPPKPNVRHVPLSGGKNLNSLRLHNRVLASVLVSMG